jgi:glycerol-3-phosphate O-acyltransferase
MKKQTAVEWLLKQITYDNGFGQRLASFKETVDLNEYFQQAKAMEKEHIIEAYRNGRTDQQTRVPKFYNRSSAIYYTSTYGS